MVKERNKKKLQDSTESAVVKISVLSASDTHDQWPRSLGASAQYPLFVIGCVFKSLIDPEARTNQRHNN